MTNMKWISSFMIAILLPVSAMAGAYDGSQPLICAVIETFECGEGENCQRGLAADVNIPQFLRIDFDKKTITGTLGNGMVKTTTVKNMETHVGKLILQGVENEMAWSVAMMVDSGKMVLSVAGEDAGYAIFGACIPDGAKEAVTESPRFFDSEQFDLIWSALQKDKRLFLSQSIALTNQENSAFWPLYEAFQKELKKTALTYFNLLGEYVAKYGALSDEDARSMLNRYLDMEAERTALKKSYADKFAKILPPKKMFRYFQLENKIESLLKFEMAQNVPMVNQE